MKTRTRSGAKLLGMLISCAVAFSMIPAMVFAADATAVNARPTSQIDAPGSEIVNGIKVEVAGEASNIGASWGIGVGTTEAGGTYTFSIDESGDYAGYVITKIEIGVNNVQNCAMAEGNQGWGTLAARTNLVWEGAATNSVSLNMVATGSGNHTVGYSAITVYVSVPPTGVTVVDASEATSGYGYVGDVIELRATVAPEATALTAVTWSTDDTTGSVEIADGVVSASAAGTYNIIATVTNYSSVSGSYGFSVYEHVSGATISQESADLYIGNTLPLTAEPTNADHVRAEDYTVTWESDARSVATVDANGLVTAVGSGEAIITATITDNGLAEPKTFEAECLISVPEGVVSMHRLYNPNSGEHFYTSDVAEYEGLVAAGWRDEGIGWIAPVHSDRPVFRLYNENGGEHHYTMSTSERDGLVAAGWRYEGIGWYSADESMVPIYRQYNPNAFANNHNYTANVTERDTLIEAGWHDEQIAWYGILPQA